MSEPRARYAVGARTNRGEKPRRAQDLSAEAAGFPGCKAVPMSAREVVRTDDSRRFEYWDAESEIAWEVREPQSAIHERPAHRLPALLDRIAEARGAAIECCGATTFYERTPAGKHIRAMEADQTIYLDAARAQALPMQPTVLGSDPPPDVVLEVDHTTDVRRRKLNEYERWRFPEVWVEVPASESSRRQPGFVIHVLDASGHYREAPASEALPGWTAEEIHLALNEPERSPRTWAALARVGQALRDQAGTAAAAPLNPVQQALQDSTIATVQQILDHRGIACSATTLAAQAAAFSIAQLVAAALACDSEQTFLATLGRLP